MNRYPHEKQQHMAGKINENGDVSPLCADPPRPLRLDREGWVAQAKHVTCKKCVSILKERGVDMATYSCFDRVSG